LHTRLSITLEEALVGFRRDIAHLDGRNVTIERNEVTRPGQVISIVDEGFVLPEYASERGDLFVTIAVTFPNTLSEEQKENVKVLFKGWNYQ
jgi:DnaJ-class molecular chaperone